jgi:hypothetical protein
MAKEQVSGREHSEELRDFYSSPDIIFIKSRKFRWTRHLPFEKRGRLGRLSHREENNIKMDVK